MNVLTYVNENKNEIVEFYFGSSMSGVFARRLPDGRWDAYQVQYQPEAWPEGPCLWYAGAPALFHPLSGEKMVAVRGSNSFRAIIEAGTPAEALIEFEKAFQEEN